MIVVVAEKPSVAKELAGYLQAHARRDGYFEGKGYQVTWALGHLVGLKDPGEYHAAFKKWTVDALPIIPDQFQLKQRGDSGAAKQLSIVRKLLQHASEIVCATDAGREGELIFRYILTLSNCEDKPSRRLWLNSLTPQAIRQAFQSMRPLSDYDSLYAAAKCRSEADWVVGMNATRFHTLTCGSTDLLLSIGRVQTPVLAMIVKRDEQIRTFKPESYWELLTEYRSITFQHKGDRFQSHGAALATRSLIAEGNFLVRSVEKRPERSLPPQLYDLTELQRDANRRFGISAANTLQIAQTLYERKLISYPRTDSRYLSRDMQNEVPGILGRLRDHKPGEIAALDLSRLRFDSRVVNSAKVTDHHAIIPTGTSPSGLSAIQQKIFDAIVIRFIAAFYPACQKEVTRVDAAAMVTEKSLAGHTQTGPSRVVADASGAFVPFRARGVRIVSEGWTALYPDRRNSSKSDNATAQKLPEFINGESGPHSPSVKQGETVPPKHFTENTLLGLMETAGKLVEEAELREAMRDKGLGTPATRAAIIETLLQRKYIVREGKTLHATQLGRYLVAKLRTPHLKSAEMTGEWEASLKRIEQGQASAETFMRDVAEFAKAMVASHDVDTESTQLGNCPQCGRSIIEGKKGFGCSGWREGCKFVFWPTHNGSALSKTQVYELLRFGSTGDAVVGSDAQQSLLTLSDSGVIVEVPVPRGDEQKPWKEIGLNSLAHSPETSTSKVAGDQDKPKKKRGSRTDGRGNLGPCPLCAQQVIEQQKSFSCSAWKTGCGFVVWKRMAGKRISKRTAKTLITLGTTSVLKGFKSKAGKPFSAKLRVDDSGQVGFEFAD